VDAHARIARTLARYCQRCDDGEWDAFEELFERDAVFSVMAEDHIGRESIRAFIEAAMPPELRGKHFLGQSDVEVDEERGAAEAATDFVFINKAREITQAGRYLDRLRRGPDGEWRFTSREIRFL
jgi:uncharacterized protein (TIGR02246 family)